MGGGGGGGRSHQLKAGLLFVQTSVVESAWILRKLYLSIHELIYEVFFLRKDFKEVK